MSTLLSLLLPPRDVLAERLLPLLFAGAAASQLTDMLHNM
jgi:hypothetical protein